MEKNICPRCGADNDEGAKFCGECGFNINEGDAQEQTSVTHSSSTPSTNATFENMPVVHKEKKNVLKWIIPICIVVLIAVVRKSKGFRQTRVN